MNPVADKKKINQELKELRQEGDMVANTKSLKEGKGFKVVVRNSKAVTKSLENYTPCFKCNATIKSNLLNRHMKTCRANDDRQLNLKSSRILLEHKLSEESQFHDVKSYVIQRMKQDELTNTVKNDVGLLMYGQKLYDKGGDESYNEISSKLRAMARLILRYREMMNSHFESLDLIDSSCWDDVVRAVKVVVSHEKQHVGLPSLLLNLGRSLASLGGIKNALGIRKKDLSMQEEAKNFLVLHGEEWSTYSKHAMDTLNDKKDNKPEELPLPSDLDKLKEFLFKEIEELTVGDEEMLRSKWSRLQRATVARLITFNARRGSEPAKLKLIQYENADDWKRPEDLKKLKDPVEKMLAKRLKVIYVKGKKKRKVPILITPEVDGAIKVLIDNRKSVGVSNQNKHLFPRPSRKSKSHVRPWEVVHECAIDAELVKPNLITSTKIRKHLATVLQLMVLNTAELKWVTDHLGHSEAVHNAWYRQEASTVELTKVARILIAKDKGRSLKNKKMDDLLGNRFFFF
ncbi:uncharacterized protein [Clytia hemisphaerica]|uniref:uncharacterized protein n=1 Tax=Clytia hemisphaerica TaxID=252671 RepID=UPI0034D507E3